MIPRLTTGIPTARTFSTPLTFAFTKRLNAREINDLTTTSYKQLQPVSITEGPQYRMPTQSREELIQATTIAGQAFGNPFWTRKAIQEEQDRTPSYTMAL